MSAVVFPLTWALLLLHLLCFSLSLAQPFDLRAISLLSITSDGSCTDTFPTVTNCRLPSTLSLTLSHPIPSTLSSSLFLILDSGDVDADGLLSLNASNPTQATATIRITGYALSTLSTSLSVYIYDQRSGNQSQTLIGGVSLAPFAVPTLATISGCQGSGLVTSLCIPDRDQWAFTGSGFTFFSALANYQLQIGTAGGWLYPSATTPGLVAVNDSYATLSVNTSYTAVLQPLHFTGQVFPLTFSLPYYSTLQSRVIRFVMQSAVSVSFGAMPPPSVQSISAQSSSFEAQSGCSPLGFSAPFDGRQAFTGCRAGLDMLWIRGQALWADTVTLSRPGNATSWPCTLASYSLSASYAFYYLPLILGDQPGQAWDLTLSTPAGSVSFPGLIAYTSAPYIGATVACRPVGDTSFLSPYCLPGQVLTMLGSGFPTPFDPSTAVVIGNGRATAPVTVQCAPVTQLDLNTLTCTLPILNGSTADAVYGQYNSMELSFPTYKLSTPTLRAYILSFPDSPVLSSVEGCTSSNGSLTLSGCRPGDVVSFTGRYLNTSSFANTYISHFDEDFRNYVYCNPLSATDTSMQCRLPYVTQETSSIQEGDLLTWSMRTTRPPLTGTGFANQPFQMTFTWQPPPTPGQSTASSNVAAIAAGVLVPVLVLALAVAVYLWYRRTHKAPSPRNAEGGSEESFRSGGWSQHFGSVEMK